MMTVLADGWKHLTDANNDTGAPLTKEGVKKWERHIEFRRRLVGTTTVAEVQYLPKQHCPLHVASTKTLKDRKTLFATLSAGSGSDPQVNRGVQAHRRCRGGE